MGPRSILGFFLSDTPQGSKEAHALQVIGRATSLSSPQRRLGWSESGLFVLRGGISGATSGRFISPGGMKSREWRLGHFVERAAAERLKPRVACRLDKAACLPACVVPSQVSGSSSRIQIGLSNRAHSIQRLRRSLHLADAAQSSFRGVIVAERRRDGGGWEVKETKNPLPGSALQHIKSSWQLSTLIPVAACQPSEGPPVFLLFPLFSTTWRASQEGRKLRQSSASQEPEKLN